MNKNKAFGQVAVEYLLAFILVALVFFAGSPSLLQRVLNAMADNFKQFTLLIALP